MGRGKETPHAPLSYLEVCMSDFLTGCLRLFSMTYHAAVSTVAFFEFMAGVLALGCCYGVFLMLYRGTRKTVK